MYQPTKSIEQGFKEFTKEQCTKALELSDGGKTPEEVVSIVLPEKVNKLSKAQIKAYGSRLVTVGRYLKYSFSK